MPFRKAIFARVGYMHYYSGSQKGDEKPLHGGAYNIKEIGHELFNFKKVKTKLFGYFQPYSPPEGSDNPVTVNIERINPKNKGNDFINNVLVIFVSKKKDYGQVIVGWYENARVNRGYQPSKKNMLRDDYWYNLQAEIKNAVLLPENYRKFKIPTGKGSFGRANIVYLSEIDGQERDLEGSKFSWIKDAIDYIDNYDGPNLLIDTTGDAEKEIEDILESHQTSQSGQGFKITPKLRKEIEEYSVSKAIQYFKKHKYSVTNVGGAKSYDLDCFKDGGTLRVEVKGTQTIGDSVILTPNEVRNAKKHKTALYILHSIKVDMVRKTYRLSGGEEKVVNPWKITEQGNLKPLSYMYFLNIIKE
jgi:hypothetical protein